MDLQLEIVGPMTGEMFIGALLDAIPNYEDAVIEAIESVCEPFPVDCRLECVRQGGLSGQRFIIEPYTRFFRHLGACPIDERESWDGLRRCILATSLPRPVSRHVLGLLMLIARHQATRHDISIEAVSFARNEAWPMLAQLIGSAVLIDGLGSSSLVCAHHQRRLRHKRWTQPARLYRGAAR